MRLGLFSFLTYWLGMTLIICLQKKMASMKTYVPNEQGLEFEKRISADKASRLRTLYEKVYRTCDIRVAMAVMTDLFINETALRIKVYNRLGISRQITFIPQEEKDRSEALTVVKSGKFTTTNEQQKGSYKEQFIDTSTGSVLWERDWAKSGFNMRLIRNPDATKVKELFCEGCGSPVTLEGEIYICKNCGAKYAADSYEWMMSNVTAWNEGVVKQADNEHSTLYNIMWKKIVPFGCMAFSILGFFSGISIVLQILTVLAIALNILLFWIASIPTILWANLPYKKIIDFDPMTTPQKVSDRASYLLGMMYGCYQTEPAKMRPFMEPACFEAWQQHLQELQQVQQNGSQAFHWESQIDSSASIRKFWVEGGKQHVIVGGLMEYWYLTPDRKAHVTGQYHSFVMCRNENVRYRRAMDVESFYCSGCGMPIDFTADGQCKFCGNGYDIAEFDWKIEAFHEHGEKTNTVVQRLFGKYAWGKKYTQKIIDKHQKELLEDKALPPKILSWDFEHYKTARAQIQAKQQPQRPTVQAEAE